MLSGKASSIRRGMELSLARQRERREEIDSRVVRIEELGCRARWDRPKGRLGWGCRQWDRVVELERHRGSSQKHWQPPCQREINTTVEQALHHSATSTQSLAHVVPHTSTHTWMNPPPSLRRSAMSFGSHKLWPKKYKKGFSYITGLQMLENKLIFFLIDSIFFLYLFFLKKIHQYSSL